MPPAPLALRAAVLVRGHWFTGLVALPELSSHEGPHSHRHLRSEALEGCDQRVIVSLGSREQQHQALYAGGVHK